MKRICAFCLAALLILSGCAKKDTPAPDLTQIRDTILTEIDVTDPMKLNAEQIAGMYSLDIQDIRSAAGFFTMGGAFPEEVLLIEAADADAGQRIQQTLEKHLADLRNQAANYDPDSYALLQTCSVHISGNCLTLFISPQLEQIQAIYDRCTK